MEIIWKYKTDIVDERVFRGIEKERGVRFPQTLEKFLLEHNAATPSRYQFMLGDLEKVFGAVLSFNRGESDVDSVFTALATVKDQKMIPFAIDPFGNYICYQTESEEVVFWDHETDIVTSTQKGLQKFIECLY